MGIKYKELQKYHILGLTKHLFVFYQQFQIIASFKYVNIIYSFWQRSKVI